MPSPRRRIAAVPSLSHPPMFSRRQAIRAGLFGVAGLSMPDLLRLQASESSDPTKHDTAVIFVFQSGGASQFETWDPKPNSPIDIRGEFNPIRTNVPDMQFSEMMVEQSCIADKLVVIRSLYHPSEQHSSSVHLIKTGYYCKPPATDNEMPSAGACAARIRGAVSPNVPPFVVLGGEHYDGASHLGRGFNPFTVKNSDEKPMLHIPNLTLVEGISGDQLHDRHRLLQSFDRTRELHDSKSGGAALGEFQRQAMELVTGPAARKAFNLDAEPLKLRDRYGRNYLGDRFVLARRLVEHGVRFVTVGTFDWDHHGTLWNRMRRDVPAFDRALATLITDIHERGLAERVLVVVMGEFGRTPRISSLGTNPPGRDHWGNVMSILLSGGGFPGGQVVGASDAVGGVPAKSPYRVECTLALMYRHLGIDPATTFNDHTGRPRDLLSVREKIRELEG